MTMGSRIRKARLAAGMTQQNLADHIGLSRTSIGAIEHGHISPRVETVERLAAALNCTTAKLFYGPRGFWARVFGWYPQIPPVQPRGMIATTIDVPQTTYSEDAKDEAEGNGERDE